MLSLEQVFFSYHKKPLIRELSFTAAPGECVVLAGPNGSGKSTALGLISGSLTPDSGRIVRREKPALVPQGIALFEDMSVADNLAFFAGLAGASVPKELPFGIESFWNKRVSKLSGGMKKRVSIACALSAGPRLLLLDEPSDGLDLIYREELAALIFELKARGCCLIYVAHETTEFSSFYDRLVFLGGPLPEVFERNELSGPAGDPLEESFRLEAAYRKLCLALPKS